MMSEDGHDGPTTQLDWSCSYTVAADGSSSWRGDRILLPHSALEGLLAAAAAREPAPLLSIQLQQAGYESPYGQPAEYLETRKLPHPLTFRLVNSENHRVAYAGVREFSAPEGEVILPPYLAHALAISAPEGPRPLRIKVQAWQLPKGRHVRLRPLEAGYVPEDWKPLLERELGRSFTALTLDTVLAVPGAGDEGRGEYRFRVDRVRPEGEAVCVIDTDLEVDIEALDEEQARETVRRLVSGQPASGAIDIWKPVGSEVAPGQSADFTLASWDRASGLEIELSGLEDETSVDLFVSPKSSRQRALPRSGLHVFGDFDPPRNGSKVIRIAATNHALEGAEAILISVHGYSGPSPGNTGNAGNAGNTDAADPGDEVRPQTTTKFTLRARAVAADAPASDPAVADAETARSADEAQCENCRQWIPRQTMVLHENFCRRNNARCPTCHVVFQKSSSAWEAHWHCPHNDGASGSSAGGRAKHDWIYHTARACGSCGAEASSLPALAAHRTTVCPDMLILCRFCHLEVAQEGDGNPFSPEAAAAALRGLTAHELNEGARTTECRLCDRVVKLLDMDAHLRLHEHDKAARRRPQVCANAICGRTRHGVGPRGEVRAGPAPSPSPSPHASATLPAPLMCSRCTGLLHASIYDPDGRAMLRRVERRYLGQIMVGCGRAWCRNEWCRTGRAALGLDVPGRSIREATPLVRPLVERMPAFFFCVDERSAAQRAVAEQIAAEGVWELEWCLAAAEESEGRADRARAWLDDWAPARKN